MRLSARQLNRTLLHRQHLLERTDATPHEMVRHLVGLQAQENLPPYLSLAARLTSFDPYDVTRGLEDRSLVRFLTMRGTVHLLIADDALVLRQWTAPVHEREIKISQAIAEARDVDRDRFLARLSDLLAHGPQPQKALGAALAEAFPDVAGHAARASWPARPRRWCSPRRAARGRAAAGWSTSTSTAGSAGRWSSRTSRRSCAATCARSDRPPQPTSPHGQASPGWCRCSRRWTTWCVHEDEQGRSLYDVPDGELADEDAPAPVRLLGQLRQRLALPRRPRPGHRPRSPATAWMGVNGGMASTLFADGMLAGLWRVTDGRVEIISTLRPLTKGERSELDDEIGRVEALLAR